MTLDDAYLAHRDALWRAAYAITGLASDADDIVQDVWLRLNRAQPDTDRPLGPWLRRVTCNLGRDRLRARKRLVYPGTWLPSPVCIGDGLPGVRCLASTAPLPPDARLDRAESVHFALLVALEQLPETGRLVLVLRDVLGCSTRETAEHLDLSEANVRVVLHRTRNHLTDAVPSDPAPYDGELVARFVDAVVRADIEALRRVLAADVEHITDSGGRVTAAGVPLHGVERVTRVLMALQRRAEVQDLQLGTLGSMPTLSLRTGSAIRRWPPRTVVMLDIAGGSIRRLLTLANPDKLSRGHAIDG